MRRLGRVVALGVLISACGPDTASAPTPMGTFRIATLLTQTRTPSPTTAGSGAPVVLSGTGTIEVGDQFFFPPQLIVTVGVTVLWINRGQLTHTATARDRSFGSGNMEFGKLHGAMIGEVAVR